ncbi:hypothetical protein L2E82_49954 [Cichorium intybus]|nr:hypothetical protein L2E82_49954 [Cichorium intybus]
MAAENSNVSLAEEIKLQANQAFKVNNFSQAIDLYTIHLEEYGSAIQDASKAVEIDPKYSKGYYRRGAAYLDFEEFAE